MREQIFNQEQNKDFKIEKIFKGNLEVEMEVSTKSEIVHTEHDELDVEFDDFAKEVNFIKIKDLDSDKSIIIDNKDLPPNFRLMKDLQDKFACQEDLVRFGDLSRKGSFLSLLHEFGHAHNDEEHQYYTITGLQQLEASQRKEVIKKLVERERGAWAYALKKFKEYKSKGINLEPDIDDLREYYTLVLKQRDLALIGLTEGQAVFIDDKEWQESLKMAYNNHDEFERLRQSLYS